MIQVERLDSSSGVYTLIPLGRIISLRSVMSSGLCNSSGVKWISWLVRY